MFPMTLRTLMVEIGIAEMYRLFVFNLKIILTAGIVCYKGE